MQDLRVSLVQTELHWLNPEANIQMFSELLGPLAGTTDLIVLPEMFLTGFTMRPKEVAEDEFGPGFEWMKTMARELGAAITGSIATRIGDQYFNRLCFVTPEGESSFYNKRHLFRMAGEHTKYTQGETREIINYRGWRILPQICYDLRFPVFSRNRNDYDLMLNVANWPEARAHAFRTLVQARAIENNSYVAAVNRIGSDGNGYAFSGGSMLIDPKGSILVERAAGKQFIATATLCADTLLQYREEFPVWMDADTFMLSDA